MMLTKFVIMLSILILIMGLFTPLSNISLAQTKTPTTPKSDFLTYEDTTNGFKMRYPSDWNKTDYPPTIPIVGFMSPAQNSTDKLFENIVVAVELLSSQNITLDQYSHSLIEQLKLSFPEFDVISPPKETVIGGVPAYNMTYTSKPPDDLSMAGKLVVTQIWAVKDSKAYLITYTKGDGQTNHDIYSAAKKMIGSFSFLPTQQIISSSQTNITNSAAQSTSFSNFSIYENSTYGIQINYPSTWMIQEEILDKEMLEYALTDNFYTVVNLWPPLENGSDDVSFGIGVGIETLPFQESTMTDYIGESIDLFRYPNPDDFRIIELNTNSSLGGKPAFRYVFSYSDNNIKQKYLQIGTIISGKVYYIYLLAPEPKYAQYLPSVERMIQSFEVVPTDKPASPPSVNDVEFLTYENSTFGIKIQYPSNWKPTDEVGLGNISFGLPDEVSSQPGLFDFMRPEEEEPPESLEDILFVEVVPLSYAVSESAFLDEFVPRWLSSVKDNLTNFNLTKSRAYALDDSPAQILEYTYEKFSQFSLSIFAVKDNILYHIEYRPWNTTSYYDNIPIIRKMIESFEILGEKGFRHVEEF